MKRLTNHRFRTVIISVVVVLVAILGAAYAGRSWLRNSGYPDYAAIRSLQAVKTAYTQTIPAADIQLMPLGLQFARSTAVSAHCEAGEYEKFRETVNCSTTTAYRSKPVTVRPDFIANWNRRSPIFESYLVRHGWRKLWNADQPIDQIFSNPLGYQSVGVNYAKFENDGMECDISITYTLSSPDPSQLFARQYCLKYTKFFGGY